jgi:aspartate aminotransferase
VFPNIAGCLGHTTPGGRQLSTDEDFALALLEEAHVAVVPGASYAMSPYIRVSTASDEVILTEGCRRIADFCDRLE